MLAWRRGFPFTLSPTGEGLAPSALIAFVGRIRRSRRIRHSFSNMVSGGQDVCSLAKAGKYLGQAAKLMIGGPPDHDNDVEHMRVNHPY